jgi:3-deoxy-D-manno-octulosonic-acid transferase
MDSFILGLYTLTTYLVRFLFFLAGLISRRPRLFLDARSKSLHFWKDHPPLHGKTVYWLHGASVGEFDQAKALGRVIKAKEPEAYLVLSWISDSVTESHQKDSPGDAHLPLPLDGPGAYKIFFEKLQPKVVVIFAWDTWAWFIISAKSFGAKIYLACATLSAESGRINFFSSRFTQMVFANLDGIFPTHKIQEDIFRGFLDFSGDRQEKPLESLGDSRFDSVIEKMESQNPPRSFQNFLSIQEENFLNQNPSILFASTYSECERGLVDWLDQTRRNGKKIQNAIWIFPHKLDSKRMNALAKDFHDREFEVHFYSDLVHNSKKYSPGEIIIFDEMGILAFAYRYAEFSYVGGGFHNRVHNVIEPAYWGLPLLTGPRIQHSSEALLLEKIGGLTRVPKPEDLGNYLDMFLSWKNHSVIGKKSWDDIRKENKNFVLEQRGASLRIYERVKFL